MKHSILLLISLSVSLLTYGQDWKGLPVPVKLPKGMAWQLHSQSDDFNYQYSVANKGTEFSKKWTDGYHNPWKGPGLTEWSPESTEVKNGYLTMTATRKKGSKKLALGCITSKTRLKYPVYLETKVKISNSVLASDVWMLSPDDTQEIDVIEAYGGVNKENKWFSERIHLSHHMFIREPFEDYQPTDDGSWYTEYGNPSWSDEFVRVGVYWKDPFTLEYYVNGVLARITEGQEMIDPDEFSGKRGIYKEMDVIVNMEDQQWRLDQGLTPSNKDLKNKEDNTYLVDWIRIYKPVLASEVKNPEIIASTVQKTVKVAATKKTEDFEIKKEIENSTVAIKETKTCPYIHVNLTEDVPGKTLSFSANNAIKRVLIIDQKMKTVSNQKYDTSSGAINIGYFPDGYYKIKLKSGRGGVTEFIYRKKG